MTDDENDYIETRSGKKVFFRFPTADMFEIEDIAHGLSNINRWTGHTKWPISVAQHSVQVAQMLRRNGYTAAVQYQGLMHDASEAYLGDVATPIKQYLHEYLAMERIMQGAINDAFGVTYPYDPAVKMADTESFRWEYRDLMSQDRIAGPMEPRAEIQFVPPHRACDEFLWEFDALREALGLEEAA